MWDLIVSVPDHCLSFYFSYLMSQNGMFPSVVLILDESKLSVFISSLDT